MSATSARSSKAAFVKWGLSDADMTDVFAGTLSEHLEAVQAWEPRKTVALLHHVPVKRLLMHPRAFVPTNWRFMNAFLGSDRFGELLVSNDVDLVFCGHIHRSKSFTLAGTSFRSVGSTYDQKELLSYDGVRVHSRAY
jgi:Icc-related predicted phosphoesterase